MTINNFPPGSEGNNYLIRITVFNMEGSSVSPIKQLKLAGVPGTPTTAPVLIQEYTNTQQFRIEMNTVTDNQGDRIQSYNLQMDSGIGDMFFDVGGNEKNSLLLSYTITDRVFRGRTYRFRYRVKNSIGWSDYSPILIAKAATVPIAPPTPKLISVTGTQITLQLFESADNEGDSITGYELWQDDGNGGAMA
jgi:hypothetical protein